jgi:hypothetical protein
MPSGDSSGRAQRARVLFGAAAFATGVLLAVWLPLGILGIVPFALTSPEVLELRVHAAAAIVCLLTAAWAFWES